MFYYSYMVYAPFSRVLFLFITCLFSFLDIVSKIICVVYANHVKCGSFLTPVQTLVVIYEEYIISA
ncbi:hypothetical protein LINPERHAP1_LOCUS32644 [Linum perenne]